jgi:hypothetical protein
MHSSASGGAKENWRRCAPLDAGAGADAEDAFEDGGVAPASTVTPLFELLLLLKSGIARAIRAPPQSVQRLAGALTSPSARRRAARADLVSVWITAIAAAASSGSAATEASPPTVYLP